MKEAPSNCPALRVRGLRKSFGEVVAVDGIDLELPRGICLGVLGPNGAGKTTTIEILEGLRHADEGEVEVLGRDFRRAAEARWIRQRIGVQLQETHLLEKLRVEEIIRLFASFYEPLEREDGSSLEPSSARHREEMLRLVGLEEKRRARVSALSGGQKQRLSLACALINDPPLLFLDEPTTGLDPQARRRIWEIVGRRAQSGTSVLLTTHFMDEAEVLCDDLMIMDGGRIIERGAPEEIVDRTFGADRILRLDVRTSEAASRLQESLLELGEVRRDEARVEVRVSGVRAGIERALEICRVVGVEVEDLWVHRPTLEDVFVTLTGRHIRD